MGFGRRARARAFTPEAFGRLARVKATRINTVRCAGVRIRAGGNHRSRCGKALAGFLRAQPSRETFGLAGGDGFAG